LAPRPNLRSEAWDEHSRDAERTGTEPARVGTPEAERLIATEAELNWVLRPNGELWVIPTQGLRDRTVKIHHTVAAAGGHVIVAGEVRFTGSGARRRISDLNVHSHYQQGNTPAQNEVLLVLARAAFTQHGFAVDDQLGSYGLSRLAR